MTRTCALIAAMLMAALPAAAAPATAGAPGHWSVQTAETVSPDRDAIAFEAGWPGVSFSYLHGTSDRSDIAVKFDLLFGFENTTDSVFGAGLDVPLRLVVNRSGRVTLGVQIEPGLRVYTQNGTSNFMTRFPVGGVLGLQATPELRLGASAGLTMAVNWTQTAFFEVGPQFGFAAEYAAERNLLVGFDFKFGPQFYSVGGNSDFAFTAQAVIGYRM
jgi:hypothetical protein